MFNKLLSILLITLIGSPALAQQTSGKFRKKYPASKLTTDLCLGVPVLQVPVPQRDWLLGSQTQFNVTRKLSIVSQTGLLLYASTFHDTKDYIKTNHSFSLMQKFGVGTTFYTRGTSNGFFLIGGIKYSSVESTMNHPDLPEINIAYSSLIPDYGVMYNLKVGRKKYYFSGRVYIPLLNLPLELTESATIELGVGIKLIQ